MVRGDDGEFELILGNRQLLSVFFVVVMLLGIFFAMGYIVGKQNVGPEAQVAKNTPPIVLDPKNPGSTSGIKPDPTAPEPAKPEPPKPEPVRKDLEPVKPEPAKPELTEPVKPVSKAEPPKPEPAKKEPPKPEPAGSEPIPGMSYLQVVASTRPDCEIIVDVLRRKGFSALIASGPSDKLYRVVVGPLNDPVSVSKAREDLEAAGFQKPYLRKY